MKRALAVLVVAMSFCSSALAAGPSVEAASREGRLEAERDIREGRLILRTYGFTSRGMTAASEKLYKRYGVRRRAVGGCVVYPALLAETKAYNDVMKAEIVKRFGTAALEEIEGPASPRPRR